VLIEGPNIYKKDGWYYLMLAEGGTGWLHGISMARSRSILGPYELDPQDAVLTARDDPSLELQKAGHGELVQTPRGQWYLAHLASRPLGSGENRRCVLGRETCIQEVVWKDGWLRMAHGNKHPRTEVPAPKELPETPWPPPSDRDEFDQPALDVRWSTLRVPADPSWLSLTDRPGWLRLRGRHSTHSLFDQSLVARRLQSCTATAETRMQFDPTHYTQMAGLICYYDTRTHYYLRVTHDESQGKVLGLVLSDDGIYNELADTTVSIPAWSDIYLRATIDREQLRFFAGPDARTWQPIGPTLDASKLSDDYGQGLHFTGAMIGLCCQDLGGTGKTADFDYFTLANA
jgi:xylan 1,4-beta-xylosidase